MYLLDPSGELLYSRSGEINPADLASRTVLGAVAGEESRELYVHQVTENGVTKVLINYETVPEPATATLGLLGLGGLLLRRKRQ